MSNGRYVYERAAQAIMVWLHMAEEDLVGHTLVTTTGDEGICRAVKLDDHHGLCFTFEERPFHVFRDDIPAVRWRPVSTIKLHGPKPCSTS